MLTSFFWILLVIILYAYPGYGLILYLITRFKKKHAAGDQKIIDSELPYVTLLIAAYNEKDVVGPKMQNTGLLDYPKDRLSVVWVTDGSDDGTPEVLKEYQDITVLHEAERHGKTAALNRAMQSIKTPFVVFCDANTLLDPKAIRHLMQGFQNERIGCVAGEKRIAKQQAEAATGAGEGTYWKYESWIKKLESDFYTTLGAAGELYAIRNELFEKVSADSIIDDFVISMSIIKKGYRILYEPKAFAMEPPSASMKDELKRKIRIASGGFQTLFRYPSLLNIFKFGFLSFEYFSHKVVRWLFVPLALPLLYLTNLLLCIDIYWLNEFFNIFFFLQTGFYLLVLLGAFLADKTLKLKILFLPYYLAAMNYAQIAGLIRYSRRKHTVVWEKAKRA
jgi:cellulose synthase/poly-beta-1,6-N-acetylglucosamine synthase-like glycosyltransferase